MTMPVQVPPSASSEDTEPALAQLLALANGDGTLAALAVGAERTVAVGEAAQPYAIAAVASRGSGRPVVVAVPSGSIADRLAHEIGVWLGPGEVAVFPAWETLPFERVSPGVETMGRRLELMWRLRRLRDGAADATAPSVIVSPVRALLQRLGPHVEDTEPLQVLKGAEVDLDELVERLAHIGYRREYQVEHRGEMAVRGSIVDVFPSTALSPVRIDLWGDEVDRLTEFSVADQRSVADLDEVVIFGCRELLPSPEVRERAASLGDSEPWGSEAWERLAEGLSFDGMESWLPWLSGDEHLLIDLLPRGAKVLLVEPRRMRERAVEIAEEEADLAGALAVTWGAEGRDFPRLYLPFDRLLSGTDASVAMLAPAPEGPGTPTISTMGWDPVAGGPERLLAQLRELTAKRYTVVVCAENEGTAARLARSLQDEGLGATVVDRAGGSGLLGVGPGGGLPRGGGANRQRLYFPRPPARGAGRRRPNGAAAAAPRRQAAGGPGGHVFRRYEDGRLRRAFPARRGPFWRHGQTLDRRRRT